MDLLKRAALEFNKLLSDTYYFEIARKVIYIFLNERAMAEKGQIPRMCCRSFFP